MSWLQEHAAVLSALASIGMMLIWVIYAWLFYQEFRRQRGSVLFIHEAGSGEPGSVCVLVNLSREPVHVLCSLASRDGTIVPLRDSSVQDDPSPVRRARQGPLGSGEAMPLASFRDIREALNRVSDPGREADAQLVEVRVAAIHGLREWPVGARRRFRVYGPSERVTPATAWTRQLRSRRHAREVQQWVDLSTDGSLPRPLG